MEHFVVTCPLVPDVPHLRLGSCTSPRSFALGFLQPTPRDVNLALLLTFGFANTWYQDLHLTSTVPCPAHTFSINGRRFMAVRVSDSERIDALVSLMFEKA